MDGTLPLHVAIAPNLQGEASTANPKAKNLQSQMVHTTISGHIEQGLLSIFYVGFTTFIPREKHEELGDQLEPSSHGIRCHNVRKQGATHLHPQYNFMILVVERGQ